MLNSRSLDYRLWVTLLLSWVAGLALLKIMPILSLKPLYLLALPLAALFFTVLVIKPKWVLILLFLSRPLLDNLLNLTKVNVSAGQGLGIGAMFNLAIIVLAVFLSFYYGSFPRQNKVVRYWLIFLFFMFLAVWYSPFRFGAMRLYFNYLSYFAMFTIPFLVIKTKEDFIFWIKIFAWSFVLPIFCADIDLLQGGRYYPDAGMRIAGTFTHPNILAFYLVLGLTLYFYILKSNLFRLKRALTWGMKLLMLNMMFLLVATKTRNAWLACFGVFFIYGLLKDRKLLLVLLLLIPLSLCVPQIHERVITVYDSKAEGYAGVNSFEWRIRMWKSSLPKIAQRPLQGYGLTSFKPMSEQFSDIGRNMGAHNAYLETLFETGIVGLLSFLGLFISLLIFFFQNMTKASSQLQAKLWALILSYVISYMIICSADNLSYYLVFNWYVWFFIGLMLVSERFSYD